ncbi:MAG: MMPL family transporter [Coriobacteriales bacterium]|jgi:predicted RND superfamily exporter protein|nr:MMPL family transporter [Coriobacteriales bacterium]
MLERFGYSILRHRTFVVAFFLAITVICGILATGVRVNPTMIDYLPSDAESTVAMNTLKGEFSGAVPNLRIMINDVSLMEALEYKQKLAAIPNIRDVMWLDDVVDLNLPLEIADLSTVQDYFRPNNETGRGSALFSLAALSGDNPAIDAIYDICDSNPAGGAVTGDALVSYAGKTLTGSGVTTAILILVPLILLILLLTTTSWIEPLLFISAIGVAVLINMGTNIFTGEVSFVTNAVSPILQLAVSLDYAIFLLHAFRDYKNEPDETGALPSPTNAMVKAMQRAFPTIAASAATTLFGFMALCFMRFGIGPNLGISLVKGVLLSFISVTIFLPALTLLCHKLLERTSHKPILPSFRRAGASILKVRIPAIILVLLLVAPCFLAQSQSNFIYGLGGYQPDTRQATDTIAIEEEFGVSTPMVVAVLRGNVILEKELTEQLAVLPSVNSVVSYADTVGLTVPPEFLDEKVVSRLYSPNLARIIMYTSAENEGEESFALVQNVRDLAATHYDESYVASQNTSIYDLKLVITADNRVVSWLAVIAIGLVILLVFRSLSLPFILVLTIQAAIWINLAIPYFTGSPIQYIGYLIVSTVQLGSTVDYAILYTSRYLARRKQQPARAAAEAAHADSFQSIIVSASILSLSGGALWLTSASPIVAALGLLLFRGTLLSMLLVCFFLPGILLLLDRFVGTTTLRSDFLRVANKLPQRNYRSSKGVKSATLSEKVQK